MKIWSNEEINLAIKRCEDGYKYGDIANEIGRTKKSVKVKLNKLGYVLSKDVYYERKICETCGKTFTSLKSEKRKYCSKSCATIKNNSLYPKREKLNKRKRLEYHKRKQNYCLNCGKLTTNKYCNQSCKGNHRKTIIFSFIENNELNKIDGNTETKNRWLKKYLIEKHGELCMKCNWNESHPITGNVPIELEHLDGNSENYSLDNVKLLCPNCHSLTPTYRALNAGNGRHSRRKRYQEGKSY